MSIKATWTNDDVLSSNNSTAKTVTEHVYEQKGCVMQRREEVVRCRDCDNLNIIGKCPCGFWALENLNGFCAWAVKR